MSRVLDDAEAVHQTRVAARRYRSMLHVFADLFDSEDARRLDEELAWYAGLLGDLRDLHVLRDAMDGAIAELADELAIDLGPVSDGSTRSCARGSGVRVAACGRPTSRAATSG